MKRNLVSAIAKPLLFCVSSACLTFASPSADACNLMNRNPSAHGTVLVKPHVFLVLWGLNSGNDTNRQIPVLQNFIQSIGGTKYLRTVSQYSGNNGTEFPQIDRNILRGVWTDPSPPPLPTPPTTGTFPTESQIRAEVLHAISTAGWTISEDSIVAVAFPPSSGTRPGECAHHEEVQFISGGLTTPYIVMPYQSAPGNCYPATTISDATTTVFTHELAETITDPHIHTLTGYREPLTPTCTTDREVGDMCGTFTRQDMTTGSVNGTYAVPTLWSNLANNSAGACVESYTKRSDLFFINPSSSFNLTHAFSDDMAFGAPENWGKPASGFDTTARVAAISATNGSLDVFALTGNGTMAHAYTSPGTPVTWNSWGTLPSPWVMTGSPSAASAGPSHVDVFVLGTTSGSVHVFHKSWDAASGSSAWTSWGKPSGVGITMDGIGAASAAPGSVDFFVSDGTNIWHGYSSDNGTTVGWNSWGHMSGQPVQGAPEASSSSSHELSAYYVSTTGQVIRRRWDSGTLNAWTDDIVQPGSTPFGSMGAAGAGEGRDWTEVSSNTNLFTGYIDSNQVKQYLSAGSSPAGFADVTSW